MDTLHIEPLKSAVCRELQAFVMSVQEPCESRARARARISAAMSHYAQTPRAHAGRTSHHSCMQRRCVVAPSARQQRARGIADKTIKAVVTRSAWNQQTCLCVAAVTNKVTDAHLLSATDDTHRERQRAHRCDRRILKANEINRSAARHHHQRVIELSNENPCRRE